MKKSQGSVATPQVSHLCPHFEQRHTHNGIDFQFRLSRSKN